MSQAKVTSIDAIRDFQIAMASFCEDAREAMCAVDMETRRFIDWVAHEQMEYWKRAIRDRQEDLSQAKNDLFRKQLEGMNSEKPDMTEQKKALRIATMRLEEAEEKLAKCRYWARALERPYEEYKGQASQLSFMVEGDPPRPIVMLERIINSLDTYVELAPPPASSQPAAAAVASPAPPTEPPAAGSPSSPNQG